MFKVLANVYHSYPASEHMGRFYKDRTAAIRYMEALSFTLDAMQKDGSVVSYDIQLVSGSKEI